MDLEKLRYLVKVLSKLQDNPNKLTWEDVKAVDPHFSEYFSQVCTRTTPALALEHLIKTEEGKKQVFDITEDGTHKLIELGDKLMQHEFQNKQNEIDNKLLNSNKLTLVLLAVSVFASLYAVTLQVEKPDLRLYTDTASNEVNDSFTLFVHNQGEEPCFNLKLNLPNSIRVYQYLNPDLYRTKFDAENESTISIQTSPLFFRWPDLQIGEYNEYFTEFIKPDEFIPYHLEITDTKMKSFWIKAKCAQSSQKLQLTLLV